jgi:hypothetical protein
MEIYPMKMNFILISILALFSATSLFAQDTTRVRGQEQTQQQQTEFIDLDGDGFNDYAPDHDGDGIPNGLDPDYQALMKQKGEEFVDLDGDGIDDRMFQEQNRVKRQGVGPQQNEKSTPESHDQKKQARRGKKQ